MNAWRWAAALALLLLTACASTPRSAPIVLPARPPDVALIPDAVPRYEPRSFLGNPPFYDVDRHRYFVLASANGYVERGVASWYGTQFHGLRTATGESYDMFAMTAAHKTLPLPCYARVTNLANGRSVVVRINDRGPFVVNRIIDLSYTAAAKLDMIRTGTAWVQVQALTVLPAPLSVSAPAAVSVSIPASAAVASLAAAGVSSVPALSESEQRALPSAPSTPVASQGARSSMAHSGGLFIQVGAFAQIEYARRASERLMASGVKDVFMLAPDQHQRLLRLRIGPIATVQQFDALIERLRSLGFSGARLAQD